MRKPAWLVSQTSAGVVGTLLDVVEVDDDLVLAFEAAVEPVLDAVLVEAGDRRPFPPSAGCARHTRGGKILPISPERGGARSRSVPTIAASLRAAVRTDDPAVAALLDRLIGDVEMLRGDPDDGDRSGARLARSAPSSPPKATVSRRSDGGSAPDAPERRGRRSSWQRQVAAAST